MLVHSLVKWVSGSSLDLDAAEQVYLAQSWQWGYGTRQPPLYTWLLLAFKPDGAPWGLVLEVVRYAWLCLWLLGVQMLARVSGADRWMQARVLLAHLGLLLVLWRVHDSLTHTVQAACLATWAMVFAVLATRQPRWWLAVGVLTALACLSKLNAAVWGVACLLTCGWLIRSTAQASTVSAWGLWRAHLPWLGLAALLLSVLMTPYAQWWLAQRSSTVVVAQVVVAQESVPMWRPMLAVLASSLEFTLLAPSVLAVWAWLQRRRASRTANVPTSPVLNWLLLHSLVGIGVLVVVFTALKGSHFTPRWLWPVAPGLTVWLSLWALNVLDHTSHRSAGRWVMTFLLAMPVLALVLALARIWEPVMNAGGCRNCWTDRPAAIWSRVLHEDHGSPLRVLTGDVHLGGILVQSSPQIMAWSVGSINLPPPRGLAQAAGACVAVWTDLDQPRPAPTALARLIARHRLADVTRRAWPMARDLQRKMWLQTVVLSPQACTEAVL